MTGSMLSQNEKMRLSEAAMTQGLWSEIEAVLDERLAAARMAYINVLWNWHEVEPDHCGGECFSAQMISAALSEMGGRHESYLEGHADGYLLGRQVHSQNKSADSQRRP